jgi:lysophospholipase L1-like esterase
VFNLGRSGWQSGELIEGQLSQAVAANPHIALVWIGANDLWYNNWPDNEADDLANYTANIDTILRTFRNAGARTWIAILDDWVKRPFPHTEAAGPLTQEDLDRLTRRVLDYNRVITQKAQEYGASLVDFYDTPIFQNPATLNEDGIHANAAGHTAVAQVWFEALRPAIAP